MGQNFLAADREQAFLLPPDVRDWLPEAHFAWFVLDAVAQMDLGVFYGAYRQDGHGRAAFEPSMVVALVLYAYARGIRSSRAIERACAEDVAFRVVAVQQVPDHTTIARFRQRHQDALAGVFGEVLALCADAGLVDAKVVAVDGTKVHANASERATRSYEDSAREILEQAAAVDAEEHERFGDARGDELPSELATGQGRQRWLRDATRRLDERRAQEAKPIARSRSERLREAKRRLEEEHHVECRANEAYEDYRRHGRMKNGRRLGAHSPPKPYQPPERPEGKINLTDLDSRNVKTPRGWVQGYNAQAVTTEDQIVIAAEVHVSSADFGQLEPMVGAARAELARAGIDEQPEAVLADAGYWHQVQMQRLAGEGLTVLVPPDANKRGGPRPGWDGGLYAFMRRVLATDRGGALYAKRRVMIEPVFADTKFNRGIDRFLRRGRAAARSEWRLTNAAHNLLKLWRHTTAPAAA
jgi:transposase